MAPPGTFGLTCLGHNIPRVARQDSSITCALRIQNTHDRTMHFQSHASFYGTPIKDTRYHLSVHVNGVFTRPVLVPNDCLRPGERVTLYFPFHAVEAGEHRLQLLIAEQHTDPVSRSGSALLEISLRVTQHRVRFDPGQQIRRGLFTLRHTEIPLRAKVLQHCFYATKLAWWRQDAATKKKMMGVYKEINRDLAFMEKQVRKRRVASLPCYLAIDTTS